MNATAARAPRTLAPSHRVALAAAAAAAALAIVAPAHAQDAEGTDRRRLGGDDVAIYNLAGTVRIVPGTGSDVQVEVARRGRDASRLEVEQGELRGKQSLRVVYPDDDVVYPALGRRSETRGRARSDGTFGDGGTSGVFSAQQVTIRSSGPGIEAWADLTVRVPRGRNVTLHLMAGAVAANDVVGDLVLDVSSATVTTERTRGRLVVDAGSGAVRVSDADGDVILDTGSGSVEVSRVRGSSLVVDAGSGRISGGDISVPSVRIDLGSGGAKLSAVSTKQLRLDTGSGDVDVELTSDVDDMLVDSGSGDVTLRIPSSLGATLDADTGRGGIDASVPIQLTRRDRDRMIGRLGDGQGRIRIDSGSGAVRIMPRG
jgi:DUF4097 and DUF4098 domain-containing protein YvlB